MRRRTMLNVNIQLGYHQPISKEKIIEANKNENITFTEKIAESDVVLAVGDDSHFLQTLRQHQFSTKPIYVGVNTTGNRGFYTNYLVEDLTYIFNERLNQPHYSSHELLKITVDDRTPVHAINECSIRSSIIKSIAIDVFIDDFKFERFTGDGLVISTPTGSTGYNKSLGGAVIDPDLDLIQLTKIAPLSNNQTQSFPSPLCLNKERKITLKIRQDGNDHPIIGLDSEAYPVFHTKSIDIELTTDKIKLLQELDTTYFKQLQQLFFN